MSYYENPDKIENELKRLSLVLSSLSGKYIDREEILYSLFLLYEDELEFDYYIP